MQKYAVIKRGVLGSCFIIRFPMDNSDDMFTEILKDCKKYYEDYYEDKEQVEIDGGCYFWDEWVSMELWREDWLPSFDINNVDYEEGLTVDYFDTLDDAIEKWIKG
jgi:hypothetical protein